ncbi:MAG: (2Fe-2S)-binding protein [Rhizobiaceae bacterium]|nr:(2Fe-2S)-binding protein [Rhizobiaceae bacterium]
MTTGSFAWRGATIPFHPGESVASALMRAGVLQLGQDGAGCRLRYFCGIGACQSCLVSVGGTIVEACLTPAGDDLNIKAVEDEDG